MDATTATGLDELALEMGIDREELGAVHRQLAVLCVARGSLYPESTALYYLDQALQGDRSVSAGEMSLPIPIQDNPRRSFKDGLRLKRWER